MSSAGILIVWTRDNQMTLTLKRLGYLFVGV